MSLCRAIWKTWSCMALFQPSDLQTKRNAEKYKNNYTRKPSGVGTCVAELILNRYQIFPDQVKSLPPHLFFICQTTVECVTSSELLRKPLHIRVKFQSKSSHAWFTENQLDLIYLSGKGRR